MNDIPGSNTSSENFNKVIWWTYLIVAVLAVPSIAFLLTATLPVSGFFALCIFIIACWACTYLGMKLMSNPKLDQPKE